MATAPPKFVNPHAQPIHLPRPNGPGYVEVRPWGEQPRLKDGVYVVEGDVFAQYVPTLQLVPFREEATPAAAQAQAPTAPPATPPAGVDNKPDDDAGDDDAGSADGGGSDSAGAGAPHSGGADAVPPSGQQADAGKQADAPQADTSKPTAKPKPKR